MNVLNRIRETAEHCGTRTAFRSREGEITYGELWERSGILAAKIAERCGEDRAPLMVYGHKSPRMLVCFLACVRSGHAYCPVDSSTPEERVREIADALGSGIVLAAEGAPNFSEAIDVMNAETIEAVIAANDAKALPRSEEVAGSDLFYLIFTSGSTGRPKGVMITADDLNNYLAWSETLAGGLAENSVFLNQAPFSFDLSVMDLYNSLATGSTLIAVDKALQQEIPEMIEYLKGSALNYWVSTPSFADLCLGEPAFSAEMLPSLKAFLFCGEVLTKRTAGMLKERFPESKVINTYGPTESTVCVTEVEVTEALLAEPGPLPIGQPKPGTEILIDAETGEMVILGNTVSPGYFGDAEKTEKVFYRAESETLTPDGSDGKVQAYRTGDLGHYDEEGRLFCDGRIDHQIKLHGYRIELGDIEANLLRMPSVASAAVIPHRCEGKVESLTAFLVREGEELTEDYAGRKKVRTALKALLPSYMVPKRIRFIEEMPLTGNGKADRKKLEEMA